jgi:hypothetical protein
MKTKITKKQFFTLIDTSKYLIEIANMDYSQGEFVDPTRTLNLACEIDKIVWGLIPDDVDHKEENKQALLKTYNELHDECVQMKESYDKGIDVPECQLAWLRHYKRWVEYNKIIMDEGWEHNNRVAPKPPFSWESVVVGGDTEA